MGIPHVDFSHVDFSEPRSDRATGLGSVTRSRLGPDFCDKVARKERERKRKSLMESTRLFARLFLLTCRNPMMFAQPRERLPFLAMAKTQTETQTARQEQGVVPVPR